MRKSCPHAGTPVRHLIEVSESQAKASEQSTENTSNADIRDGETVLLRGTKHGLEIHIDSLATCQSVFVELNEKLEASPSFFSGAKVTIRYSNGPIVGMLSRLEDIAMRFNLSIVSVRTEGDDAVAALKANKAGRAPVATPRPGREPDTEPDGGTGSEANSGSQSLKNSNAELATEMLASDTNAPKLLTGPIRSGRVLEFDSHVIVLGDMNPGAEIVASGSIIVLGRLRGVAHAGATGGDGFIIALDMTPQQLRIGSLVARSGDEQGLGKAEIAYATKGGICVDEFTGKLPAAIRTAKL